MPISGDDLPNSLTQKESTVNSDLRSQMPEATPPPGGGRVASIPTRVAATVLLAVSLLAVGGVAVVNAASPSASSAPAASGAPAPSGAPGGGTMPGGCPGM
jgi:hypothetical protein